MKSIVPVIMAGVLGIYGLIIAVIVSTGSTFHLHIMTNMWRDSPPCLAAIERLQECKTSAYGRAHFPRSVVQLPPPGTHFSRAMRICPLGCLAGLDLWPLVCASVS